MKAWLTHFLSGSIRRRIQIVTFAPIFIFGTIAFSIQPSVQDNIAHESKVAIRIQQVVSQFAAAKDAAEASTLLDMTTRAGLGAERLFPDEASAAMTPARSAPAGLRDVRDQLPSWMEPTLLRRAEKPSQDPVVAVTLRDGSMLAFTPEAGPPIPFFAEDRVDIALLIAAVTLPLLLLSLYADRMIMAPLTRFAKAALALDPDIGPDRPFDENGVREISQLARALNEMRERIRRMIDERTGMVRAISHDLRTPLTRLRMRAERSSDTTLRQTMLGDIARIDALVEETLTYLRRDVASEERMSVDLPSLLETVCDDFANLDLPVSYEGPHRLAFDCKPQALFRAITNLVDNGLKFAGTVTVGLEVESDGGVRILVADDGPGIPPQLREKVLAPYFKADASRSAAAPGGYGLGLSIVHDIVRGHDGSMSLLDGEPRGLVVEIRLRTGGDRQHAGRSQIRPYRQAAVLARSG